MVDAAGEGAKVLVGVDGGGTKTDCVAMDTSTHQVVGRAVGGASNWNSTGKDTALKSLKGSIAGALAAAGLEVGAVAGVCVGMSGVDRPADVDMVRHSLQAWLPVGAEILVYNDSVIALACGTGGSLHGCVLIIGTGTIALAVGPDGSHVRASGWGPAFMDGGSGYDIGQRALAAVSRAVDGRGPSTDLVLAACAFCEVDSPTDLLGWAYAEPGWARIASLAPAVLRCAEEGDPVAFRIVTAAADEAVSSVVAAATAARLKGQRFRLVLSGGLLSADSPFLDVVREAIKLALPSAELVHPRVEPALGAALLAHQRLLGCPPEEPHAAFASSSHNAHGADSPLRDPFALPPGSPLRTPDPLRRHRHHRRTPSSLGREQSLPAERRSQVRGHRRVASSLDPAFDAVQDKGYPPLLRKAASAHVQPPGLESLSIQDSCNAEHTNGSHHPKGLPSVAGAVGAKS